MIEFSTNKHIHNIQIKHHIYIYIYIYIYIIREATNKIKLFSSNGLLIDKLNQKISLKMLRQIGLIHLFCSPYLPRGSIGFLFLSSIFSKQDHTNKQLSSLVDSHAYNPLVCFTKSHSHYIANISSTLPRKYLVPTSCPYLSLGLD